MPTIIPENIWNLSQATMVQASGTSTSGTPGTTVASILAAAGTQLVFFSIFTTQSIAAATQVSVTVFYSDNTSTADTTTAGSAAMQAVNYGGIVRYNGAAFSAVTALSAKPVTFITVTTTGTGVGTRGAVISAWQIPI